MAEESKFASPEEEIDDCMDGRKRTEERAHKHRMHELHMLHAHARAAVTNWRWKGVAEFSLDYSLRLSQSGAPSIPGLIRTEASKLNRPYIQMVRRQEFMIDCFQLSVPAFKRFNHLVAPLIIVAADRESEDRVRAGSGASPPLRHE
jgi:hypothetical protein